MATAPQQGHDDAALLTKGRAARMLGVSVETVARMIDRGTLAVVAPTGRRQYVPRSEVERLARGEAR